MKRAVLGASALFWLVTALACGPYKPYGDVDACLSCHQGIERIHTPLAEGDCISCHGGDPEARTKEAAHVPVPDNWADIRGPGLPPAPEGFIRDFAPDQLDALPLDYVQFINPGDMRVLDRTCGPCHPDQSATMPNSVMTTNAGHYYPTLYLAGLQDERIAHYGSFPAIDDDCDPESIPGSVCEVETLLPPTSGQMEALFSDGTPPEDELLDLAYRHYLSKNCNTCHHAGFNRNDSPGRYRSAGCSGCHVVYDKLGTYQGGDPMIPTGVPVHPKEHVITSAIPSEQCATCHHQGARIGLLYRGIREGGFGSAFTPENATPIPETLYGHAPGYYFTDEDDRNDFDETPPDLHYQAGMECVDCHVGQDVHGDGRIYSSIKHQLTLICEDCHGTVREAARPDSDGVFRKEAGGALPQLELASDGSVMLIRKKDGEALKVPQPAHLLAEGGGGSAAMHQAMGLDAEGWSHTDSLKCDSCHSSHLQYCIGCHVSLDLRINQIDYQTGQATPGLTRGSRSAYSLDKLLLGTATDGRIQPVHPSQQVQLAVRGSQDFGTEDGELLVGGMVPNEDGEEEAVGTFRSAHGMYPNNGFVPLFQHTSSATPRPCRSCHRENDSASEEQRVKGVYGFGTGDFMLTTSDGSQIDGLQFVNSEGEATTTWVHPNTGPVGPGPRNRALNVSLESK